MNKFLFPIYAVLLGVFFARISKNSNIWNTKLLLAFSGAFLLAMTLFDLLPEVYNSLGYKITGLLILVGILLQIILKYFSKGAEHGKNHVQNNKKSFQWMLFLSLCIHSLLEGFPIHQHNDMVYGVAFHKIPIATLLALFLFETSLNKIKIYGILLIFAVMTPVGTILSNEVAFLSDYVMYINALVIGIFFHISTTILIRKGEGLRFNLLKLVMIIAGIGLGYFFNYV